MLDSVVTDGLFVRWKEGDPRAPDEFAAAIRPILLRVARSIVRDPALAEDVVQETLARCLPVVGRLDHVGAAVAYCRRTARNLAVDHVRERSRAVPLSGREIGRAPSAESSLLQHERREALWHALALLNEPDSSVIRSFYAEGRTYAQIGSELGTSEATVKRILGRVRLRLARLLADVEPSHGD